ncbi:photosynthetic reaction center subunit H [Rhodopila sp.]|uniref:photosynthetic reaction center subunit H n=1 Tax=Rhodopila sp. TaxID=2480087 RepID=UPI003D0EA00C
MQAGAITGYIDVAQVALYVFWVFFAGLVYYLRREDKREGYPLVTEQPGQRLQGFPFLPTPKTFLLYSGEEVQVPRPDDQEPEYDAVPAEGFPGAPLLPLGNPMLAGIGPGASALRADKPDRMIETNSIKILPMRVLPLYFVPEESPDPRGMEVVGADGVVGGIVTDMWIDKAEDVVRYLEVTLAAGPSVLLPKPLAKVNMTARQVVAVSVMGGQFADAPLRANADEVTTREEDRIQAYFGSGHMYAKPSRMEPLL